MISTISILLLTGFVLTLIMILKLILSFHEKDEFVEVELQGRENRGHL
ncbi:MAG: hypothetical protein PVF76_14150 [Syntrophobacterales bacterium]|jgi:hypothetical protein